MTYFNVPFSELIDKKILSTDEADFISNLRIPCQDKASGKLWAEKLRLDSVVTSAIKNKIVTPAPNEVVGNQTSAYIISDDLGIKGVLNPATGKIHNSKSAYYKDVKSSGCVVLGTDAKAEARNKQVSINQNELKRDIKQSIEQVRGRL